MIDQDEELPRRRAHPKNSKKWCRGKEGKEHVTEIVFPENAGWSKCHPTTEDFWKRYDWEVGCYHVERCINCGKHVRTHLKRGECPSMGDRS